MTYGLDRSRRVGFAAWRKLDQQSRLHLVERQLKPADDLGDGYPPAL